MPAAPPATHRSLPQTCGSGKNGARPNVRLTRRRNFQSFNIFIFEELMGQIYGRKERVSVTALTDAGDLTLLGAIADHRTLHLAIRKTGHQFVACFQIGA